MLLVPSLVAVFLIILSYAKFYKVVNPVSIIIIWYFGLIWISRLGIQDLYIPSVDSSFLLMVNIVFLASIVLFTAKGGQTKISEDARARSKESDTNMIVKRPWLYSVRKYCEIICLITVVAIDLNISIKLLTGAISAEQIRYALIFQEASSSFNANFLYFNSFIRDFLTYFVRFFVFFDFLIELCNLGMYNKQLRIIPMLNYGLFCFSMLTRIDIFKAAILLGIIFLFVKEKNKRKRLSKKNKRILTLAILSALVVIVMRVYEGDNIIDFTIRNFSGSLIAPFEAFSIYFDHFRDYGPIVDFAVIRVFFNGITAIVEAILVNLLKLNIPVVVKTVNATLNDIIYVGQGQTFNAFYTMYYEFLASGGIFGTFLGSLMCGFSLSFTYNHYHDHPCLSSCILFVLWQYIVLFGVIQWRGGLTEWACVICVILANRIIIR